MRAADPLYKTEQDIAARVLGDDAKRWPELSALLERDGLPRKDPLTGMRFWPAVELFSSIVMVFGAAGAGYDGVETWSEPQMRRA